MARRSTSELIHSSEWAIMGAVLMISLGSVGLFLSMAIGSAPNTTLSACIFVTSGFAYFLYAFATRGDGEALWRMLIGFVYLFGGVYLFLFFVPGLQVKRVIFVVGTIVLFEGVAEFFVFSRLRPREGSEWIVAGAIATIFLAFVIWCLAPFSSMRLLGGIVSTKFVISGVSRLMYSVTTHKKLEAIAKENGLLTARGRIGPIAEGLNPAAEGWPIPGGCVLARSPAVSRMVWRCVGTQDSSISVRSAGCVNGGTQTGAERSHGTQSRVENADADKQVRDSQPSSIKTG